MSDDNLIQSLPVTGAGTIAALPVGCVYMGMVARAGAAGVVEIRDGSATGTLLDSLTFGAAGSGATWFGDCGVFSQGRPWAVLVSGTWPTVLAVRHQ